MQAADSLEQVRRIVSDAVAATPGAPVGKMILSLLIGLAIGGFVSFYIGVARGRGMKGSIKEWVADLATLNYRVVITIWLAVGFITVITIAMLLHAIWPRVVGELQEGIVDSVLIALTLWLGIDVGAAIGKRLTYKRDIESVQNAVSAKNTQEHRAANLPPPPPAPPADEVPMMAAGVQLPADPNASAVRSYDPGA